MKFKIYPAADQFYYAGWHGHEPREKDIVSKMHPSREKCVKEIRKIDPKAKINDAVTYTTPTFKC